MKSDKNLIFADIVYFGLIYPSEKKRENSNRGKSCPPRFLYSIPTLVEEIAFSLNHVIIRLATVANNFLKELNVMIFKIM